MALSKGVVNKRVQLKSLKDKINDGSKFTVDTYNEMLEISFDSITKEFFDVIIQNASIYIDAKTDILSITEAETSLHSFCMEQGFKSPEELYQTANDIDEEPELDRPYLGIELIEDGISTEVLNNRFKEIKDAFVVGKNKICSNEGGTRILISGQEEFERYFIKAGIPNKNAI